MDQIQIHLNCIFRTILYFNITCIFCSFITYEACKHLDGSHTIFGRLVGGLAVLSELEKQPASTEDKEKPLTDIKIVSTRIVEDPFANPALKSAIK